MSNKFQIKFTAGTLASQVFEIQPGVVIALGRSRSNTIVLSEPDVSARHCILRQDQQAEEGIWIEVVSSRTTVLDGKALQIGDKALITDGKQVTLGEKAAFVLMKVANNTAENDDMPTGQIQNGDDMQTQAVPAEDDQQTRAATMEKTAAQAQTAEQNPAPETAAAGSDTEFETVAVQTRIASTEEIDFIRRGHQKKRLIRFWLIVIPIVIFVAASFALYFQPQEEPVLIWPETDPPGAQKGCLFTDYVKIIFPGTCDMSYKKVECYLHKKEECYLHKKEECYLHKKEEYYLEAHSAFGKNREIPLNVYAQRWISLDSLTKTRLQAFHDECLAHLKEKKLDTHLKLESGHALHPKWTASETMKKENNGSTSFINENSAGVPVIYTAYSRDAVDQNGNTTSMSGFLIFFRSGALCGYAMFEIPSAFFDKNKNRELFQSLLWDLFIISAPADDPDFAGKYWEGSPDYDEKTNIPDLMKQIEDLEKEGGYTNWWERYYKIRSVLIRLRKQGVMDGNFAKAGNHLLNLRKEQKNTYAKWRSIMTGSSRETEKTRVKRDSKQAFSPEFESIDYRYGTIRREEW